MTITNVVLGAVTLRAATVEKPHKPRVVKHQIPSRDGAVIQHMGWDSREFRLKGRLYGSTREADKALLEGYRDASATVAYSDGEDSRQVTVLDAVIVRDGLQPLSYTFEIDLIEYSQT